MPVNLSLRIADWVENDHSILSLNRPLWMLDREIGQFMPASLLYVVLSDVRTSHLPLLLRSLLFLVGGLLCLVVLCHCQCHLSGSRAALIRLQITNSAV